MNKVHYSWKVLIACCALTLGLGLTNSCLSVYIVPVCSELGFSNASFSLSLTITALAMAVSATFVGRVLPRGNIKLLQSVAYIIYIAAIAICGTFTQVWQWYVAAIVQGFFSSFVAVVAASTIINNWFVKKVGFAMSLVMSFSGIGSMIMSPILAQIIEKFGWRIAYVINAGIAGICVLPFILLVMVFKPADKGMLPYGYEESAQAQETQSAETVSLTGMPFKEAKKTLSFWCMFASFALMCFVSVYVRQFSPYAASIGLSATVGAFMMSANSAGGIAGKFILGIVNDKWGMKVMTVFGMGCMTVAFVLLLLCGGSVPMLITASVLSGVGSGLTTVGTPLMTRSIFGAKYYNEIYPILTIAITAIGCFGSTILGLVFDITGSFVPTFVVGIIAAVATLVLLMVAFANGKKLKQHWK